MAFSTETGSSTATSYCTVEFADAFNDLLGNEDWAGLSDDDKKRYLNQATLAIDTNYTDKFRSYKNTDAQSLQWPRCRFYDGNQLLRGADVVPVEVQRATSALAFRLSTGEASLFPEVNSVNNIQSQTTTVGEITTSITYMKPLDQEKFDGYAEPEKLMKPVLKSKKKTAQIGL